ncbi:hypothetical protein GQR58_012522 [Nymphon striatum]|nr:hypothetical protein GQR58_012522 [Nymphon striatum]
MGQYQNTISLASSSEGKNHNLPDSFTIVPAVALKNCDVSVPKAMSPYMPKGQIDEAKHRENCWLEIAMKLLEKENIKRLLPLFYEKAATAAMIKHGMDVQRKAINYLNPGQIPVYAMDAPLFVLSKLVQWKWPYTHGEDKQVVMLGGLHIEMAMWKTYGDYLDSSG